MNSTINKLPSSFKWLNFTQFFGALNDNIFKLFMIFFLIDYHGVENSSQVVATIGAVFVIPFLLFSAAGGTLADRTSKRNIIIYVKFIEGTVMILGLLSFYFQNPYGLYLALFLMASQSAFFGPSKYGIVPEIVEKHQISYANGLLTSLTYLSIIIGTSLAPIITQLTNKNYGLSSLFCILFALLGISTSFLIKKTDSQKSGKKISPLFIKEIWLTLLSIRQNKYLLLAVCGSAYFLFIGAFIQLNIIPYGIEFVGLDQVKSGYLFLIAALGIGSGGLLTGFVSGRHIEFGLVPLGALGLSIGLIALNFIPPHIPLVASLIFLLGICSGLFIVPIQSFIQYKSPNANRGEIIAACGFLSWIGALLAALLIYFLSNIISLVPSQGFLIIGIITLILTIKTIFILPVFLIRTIIILISKLFYRTNCSGNEYIPTHGPALLVANDVSIMDPFLINAFTTRRIRFLIDKELFKNKIIHFLFNLMGAESISFHDSAYQINQTLMKIKASLQEGHVVCLLTKEFFIQNELYESSHSQYIKILSDIDIPIIPVYFKGLWKSVFHKAYLKQIFSSPKKFHYCAEIIFGKPLNMQSNSFKEHAREIFKNL